MSPVPYPSTPFSIPLYALIPRQGGHIYSPKRWCSLLQALFFAEISVQLSKSWSDGEVQKQHNYCSSTTIWDMQKYICHNVGGDHVDCRITCLLDQVQLPQNSKSSNAFMSTKQWQQLYFSHQSSFSLVIPPIWRKSGQTVAWRTVVVVLSNSHW